MVKSVLFILLFFCSLHSFSQKLIYKSDGTILNSENQRILPVTVRAMLANNEKLLSDYNAGRRKKTIGNIMLYGGMGIVIYDLATVIIDNAFADVFSKLVATGLTGSEGGKSGRRAKPSVATYIGLASFVTSIPIKIGFSEKIKNVVTEYNNEATTVYKQFNEKKLDLITNSNGIGLRLTIN